MGEIEPKELIKLGDYLVNSLKWGYHSGIEGVSKIFERVATLDNNLMTMVIFEISQGHGSNFTNDTCQQVLVDVVRFYAPKPDSHPYLISVLSHLSSLDPCHLLTALCTLNTLLTANKLDLSHFTTL